MKFTITTYENLKEKATVHNESKNDFVAERLTVPAGEKVDTTIELAKFYLGDWEDHTYGEQLRRKDKNIHQFILKIRTEIAEISRVASESDKVVETKVTEPEFAALHELDKEEPVTCHGTTKAGKPCKREALPHTHYCAFHKE